METKFRRVKCYLASPYSAGDKEKLANFQFEAACRLLEMEFNVYAPLYNHYVQQYSLNGADVTDWLEVDKEWIGCCDMVIRLHVRTEPDAPDFYIESPGADAECEYANQLGIPILEFNGIQDMVDFMSFVGTHKKIQ